MTKVKGQNFDKNTKAKIYAFLEKFTTDETSAGLHIEKMNQAVDSRARTARVDQSLRAVLYLLEPVGGERTYVYAGTWEHDEAIERARTRTFRTNPVSGVAELVDMSIEAPSIDYTPAPPQASGVGSVTEATESTTQQSVPLLESLNYSVSSLTEVFGFSDELATRAFAQLTEDALLEFAASLENDWQGAVLLDMAVGKSISDIKADLQIDDEYVSLDDQKSEDDKLVAALQHPAARMQFTLVDNNDELRRVIEGGDFGAWRVFLHPEQRRYADPTKPYNGPFRLSGGAGTGKTVVLLHRARNLAKQNPNARIVLTTFTRALSGNLERDLERLDPDVPIASELGQPGIRVLGIDQIAAAVRSRNGSFSEAAIDVLGYRVESTFRPGRNQDGWGEAIAEVAPDLPPAIANKAFFEAEYLQVILPNALTEEADYLRVRRPGRGVALDRKKRMLVWSVVERYRKNSKLEGRVSFAEIAMIAAQCAEQSGESRFADHLLIDEGQDLSAAHWKLMRALVPEGQNDLFIAEDTHQRIYGQHVVLSRYGINIVGRSRRLTLNYRTTEQNLRYALSILEGGEYVDAENGEETIGGYRSSRLGPEPRLVKASSTPELLSSTAECVQNWLDEGVKPETIAVLAHRNDDLVAISEGLAQRGIPATVLKSASLTGERPVVLTMHTAKGMEFSRVILYDISEGTYPPSWATSDVAPEDVADVELRFRSLLYVAASRARDELVVSFVRHLSKIIAGALRLP
ncbi:3'-5' exonuclease [Paramicrobacterium agarici]|nr:3'-5' exonuclease [Microbacterium agarici]